MAKKVRQTPAQKAYAKERRRIQQFIRRAEKRGYIFDNNILPQQPKRITKASVAKLKKITPNLIYKKGRYIDQSTGEIIKGLKGRELERKRATEKAAETRRKKKTKKKPNIADIIIQNFISYISGFPDLISKEILLWFHNLELRYTKNELAKMLEDSEQAGIHLADYLANPAYDSGQAAYFYCMALLDFLPLGGEGLDRQKMGDLFEQEEYDWEDWQEGDDW